MGHRQHAPARRDPDSGELQERPGTLDVSDDDSGNEDLTLEILDRARKRSAAEKDASLATPFTPVADVESKKKRKRIRREKREMLPPPPVVDAESEKVELSQIVDEEDAPKVTTVEEEQAGFDSVVTEVNDSSDNLILRKLLRGPRYFDPGESIVDTCFNCGEEGHVAADCPMERRQKPCFVCGLFGHSARQCTQGQDCFTCKKKGHIAKDCPDKNKRLPQHYILCLRCGEAGHDMFSCDNGYPSDDMKEIECYICKKRGHLCCADFTNSFLSEVSCYMCAQPGHTGLGCMRRYGSDSNAASTCYICGEQGHFARGCTSKPKRVGENSAPLKRSALKANVEFKSAPQGVKRTKRKHVAYDKRDSSKVKFKDYGGWMPDEMDETPSFKSRGKGGWIPDETEDWPMGKFRGRNGQLHAEANYSHSKKYKQGWSSPRTPGYNHHKNYKYGSERSYSTSSSFKKQKSYSSNSNSVRSSQKYGYSKRHKYSGM